MTMHKIRSCQKLPIGRQAAWDFFSDPQNLKVLTPDKMHMRFIDLDDGPLHTGKIIAFKLEPLPYFRTTWVSEITQVKAPDYFVDEQRTGPYAIWHHQHFFREVEGGTEVEDVIQYKLPLGWFGNWLNKPLVKPRIQALLDYRKEKLTELFGNLK